MNKLKELRHFPQFVKLSHSVFAMPFALASLILAAHGFPSWRILGLVIGAVVTARTTAMAFNRIVDIQFDAANPRTIGRHLPSGKISIFIAWLIVIVAAGLFLLFSASINSLAGRLSPVVLIVIWGYSFTKRFTYLSHLFLGLALGLAPLGAWVAVRADLNDLLPWLLTLAVGCWVTGFDIIYALQDMEFDKSHGLYSMAATFGPKRSLQWVRLLHLGMFLILIWIGFLSKMGWPYFIGLIFVLVSLIWEQILILNPNPGSLQKAFLQANTVVSFGYLGAVVLGVFL